MTTYPLLDSQLGILLSCGASPTSTAWNLPSVIVFDKTVSAERLLRSLKDICAARAELHVQFTRTEEGTIRQYVAPAMDIPVLHLKMSDREAEQYMRGAFTRPFLLFRHQPLCRFEIVETATRTLLLSDFHHSIADGFTIAGRFIGSDLPAAYGGQALRQPLLSLFEWAQREQDSMQTPAYTRAKSYYQALFAGEEGTRLPSGKPFRAGGSGASGASGASGLSSPSRLSGSSGLSGSSVSSIPSISSVHSVPRGRGIMASTYLPMKAVDAWCAGRRMASYHFLLAAFSLTLSKLSHQQKVVFCTLNHGRYDKRLGEAYGMFVSTMPFVAAIEPGMTLDMLVEQVKKRLMENYRHRTYPFTHFCADMGFVPKITFGFQSNGILEQAVIEGHRYKGMQLPHPDSQSDLSVMIYSSGEDYEIRVEASDALYGEDDLKRFGAALRNCACHLMSLENGPIEGVDLVDDKQKEQISIEHMLKD